MDGARFTASRGAVQEGADRGSGSGPRPAGVRGRAGPGALGPREPPDGGGRAAPRPGRGGPGPAQSRPGSPRPAPQARAALDLAGSRLRETTIVSPINGVCLRKNLEVGEMANPGVSILTLVDPTDIWLRAYVPETDIGRIKIGMAARITIDAFKDRTFTGKITEIASEAEFTPKNVQTKKERVNLVFRIKIALDNPEGLLKPGMPADADILL
ncbi:MAG: efflux RND transporter periplasmic adaptor subunit [Candidatus Rokubacteria bacterium]|nr:efflux RND transporter periplasmic adaptor subunit [Candidatus Rokubacteria bacterium]